MILQKILLENVSVSNAKNYTKGNVNFELSMQEYSTITVLGEFNPLKNAKILKIKFEEIPFKRGYISNNFFLNNTYNYFIK